MENPILSIEVKHPPSSNTSKMINILKNDLTVQKLKDEIKKKFRLSQIPTTIYGVLNDRFVEIEEILDIQTVMNKNSYFVIEAPAQQQVTSQQEKNLIVTLAKEDRKSLVKDIVKNLKRKYNPWEITSSQRTQSEQENFRKDLIQYYQCDDGTGKIRCMLLNQHFQKKVIAAHLIPCASKNTFEDIDLDPDALFNVRNGLMLYESIEKAFDRLDVCFWWDSVENDPMKKLKFLVLDPNLKATKVVVDPTLNISTTFQDLNNQPLNVPQENGKPKYPYLRVLNWHGKCAIQKAISRSWIPKSYQYEDFYSHSVSSKTFNFNNEDLD